MWGSGLYPVCCRTRKANQPTRLKDVDFDMILVRKLQMIEIFGKGRLSEKKIEHGIAYMRAVDAAITKQFPQHGRHSVKT